MAIETMYVFVNVVIMLAGIVMLIFAGRSYTRFLEGQFKTILRWVLYSFVLFILYKSLNIIALLNINSSALLVFSDLVFLVAVVCAFVSMKELHDFSMTYGFRNHKMPNHSEVKKVVKKKAKKRKSRR